MPKIPLKEKITDQDLIEQMKAGDHTSQQAENTLFGRYESYSYGYLMKHFGLKKEEGREVLLRAMTDAMLAIRNGKFRSDSAFRTYYTRILINKKNDYLRDKARLTHVDLEEKAALDTRIKDHSESDLSDRETFRLVTNIFSKLANKVIPSNYTYEETIHSPSFIANECLQFYKMQADGFSWEVIAHRLNMTVPAAKQKEARCLNKLKKALMKDYYKEFQILLRSYTRKKFKNG